ncbi:hypothetical protein RMATCC62417_05408 [Rhizopus microsporus]|nr:hypothetical protein RMATCC62417_05408 [Rhizopus microsporus]CEI85810.1 hypothetical protein RMCBS344292_00261 [Rhizopus microsporus]
MCFPTFTALGSIFLLFSFVLELFILIGQLSRRVFLTDLFFAAAWNTGQNVRYNFALWNYCTADINDNVNSCAHPIPAFNWATTPGISNLTQAQASSGTVHGVFMAMFILFFIGCGLSFLLWLASLPICCLNRRVCGISMATLVFINFLVMLAALILALVVVISGVKIISANAGWNAHANNLLWITIGAVISLLLAAACYSCGSVGGSRNRRGRKKRVDPDYDDKDNHGFYDSFLPYNVNPHAHGPGQGGYGRPTHLQQPYQPGNQPDTNQAPAGVGHQGIASPHPDATKAPQTSNEHSNVPRGYQTPTLQPANLPDQQ